MKKTFEELQCLDYLHHNGFNQLFTITVKDSNGMVLGRCLEKQLWAVSKEYYEKNIMYFDYIESDCCHSMN